MTVDQWQPTRALRRAVGLVCLLLVAAVALGRADLAVVALPFVVGTLWALRRRPRQPPQVVVTLPATRVVEGEHLTAVVSVANPTDTPMEPVVVSPAASRWLVFADSPDSAGDPPPPVATRLPSEMTGDVPLRLHAVRWGRHGLGPVTVTAAACDGLLACSPQVVDPCEIGVHPLTERFEADEAIPRAAGLTGTHRSQRPGEGGELVGVRRFAPGDRLRRIDWRVSLRTRQLHVAATLSDREAEVVLLLDTLHEAGVSGGVHGASSVLDTTVRGAAAVAEHYLRRGDRVSLLEFGPRHRQLPTAGGRWQYQLVREWLLDTHVVPGVVDPENWLARPYALAPNTLIVAFTPLLDERSAELLARLGRAGRFLIAVDTLPPGAGPATDSPWRDVGTTLWRLGRQNTIEELRSHGIPVVAWRGSGTLDEMLRHVARAALSTRPVVAR